jgi:hypothetical protein
METVWEYSPPSQYPLIVLTENQWGNANFPDGGGYIYFTFTATSSSHHIHFSPGMSSPGLLDINGKSLSFKTSYPSNGIDFKKLEYSVIPGQKYYIRCYSDYYTARNFIICFNSLSTPPALP